MSDQVTDLPLSEQIKNLVEDKTSQGEYVTVRLAAKTLNVKQTDIKENLPQGAGLIPSQNGTLSESKISFDLPTTVVTPDEVQKAKEAKPQVQKMQPRKVQKMSDQVEDLTLQDVSAEEGTETSEENVELAVCTVCGNKVRKSTMTRRGICPLCFSQLARNSGIKQNALMAMSDEEFQVLVGEELGRRRNLEEYKISRQLTAEEFEARKADLIPVKELFAAGKEAGFGPGRVAQAVGGDRFRHEPVGGFGSVWTPYFVGARKAWYFDKDILNHWDDLRKPVKEKVEKPKKEKAARDGNRGAKMTPVPEAMAEAPVSPE